MSTTVDYVYAEIRATPAGALLATLNNITDVRINEMLDEAGQFSFLIPNTAVNPAVIKYWHCVKFYSKVGSNPGVYLGGGRITQIEDRWSGVKDTTLVTGFDHLIDLGELKVQYGEISELVWVTPLETQKVVYNAEEVTDLPLLRDGDTTVGVQGVDLVTPDGSTVGSWLYVGHESPFWMAKFYVKLPDGGFIWANTVPGTMQVEPFDVNDWKWRNPTDGTAVGGIPFKQTGVVEWYRNDYEMQVTHDGKHLYWARFLVTPNGTSVFGLFEIEIAVAMPTNDDLNQLLDLAPGWSAENDHLHIGKTAFSIRGESVLLLLRRIAEHTQEHFRLNSYGLITWLGKSTSFTSSGITAVQEPEESHASSPEDWCYFKSLRRKQDYSQVITRINPLGNGEDGAQINLSQVDLAGLDLPAGYAIDELNNWVINVDLEAELGVEKPAYRTYPEVAPLSGGVNTTVAESNMLATAAIAELKRHEGEGKYYELSEVVGLTGSLKVGQLLDLYHQPLNQDGTVKETIDETMVVTAIERQYGRDGRVAVNLEISTVAQHAPTPERLAVRKQRDAQVRNLHPKPIRVDRLSGDAAGGLRGGVSANSEDLAAHMEDTEAHNIPAQITTAIATHSTLPNAHHNQSHVLANTSGLGPDHTVSGLTSGQVLKATSATAAVFAALNYSELANRTHSITAEHSIAGSPGDVVGNASGSVGLITPVSDGNATKNRLLKTDTNGLLKVTTLQTAGAIEVGTDLDILDDLYVGGSIGGASGVLNTAGDRVGIGMIPDPQFALDISGNIRWSGYGVGQMALQVEGVTALFHYDGVLTGHMGQAGTNTGIIFDEGKFGRGMFADVSLTNRIVNPRFMGTYASGIAPHYSGYANGSGAGTRSEETILYRVGTKAQRINKTAGTGSSTHRYGISCTYSAAGGTKSMMSAWVYVTSYTAGAVIRLKADSSGGPGADFLGTTVTITNSMVGKWTKVVATDSSHTATSGTITAFIWIETQNANIVIDQFMMIEGTDYDVPFFCGSDDGATWASTADASASTKAASTATYPIGTLGITPAVGTMMVWVKLLEPNVATQKQLVTMYTSLGDQFIVYINGTSNTVNCAISGNGVTANIGTLTTADWTHIAFVWQQGALLKMYINGMETSGETVLTTLFSLPTTLYVGSNQSTANQLKGVLDELVWVDRAMPADEILAVYESNAPVFAPTSTFEFAAGPEQLVWANENGLFTRDVDGNAVFAVVGRDGISWGGDTLDTGDLLIGKFTGGYMHWDNSLPKLTINADIDELRIGSTILLNSNGITINPGNAAVNSLKWKTGATTTAEFYNDIAGTTLVGTLITTNGISSATKATLGIYAQPYAGSGYRKSIDYTANNDGTGDISLKINGTTKLKLDSYVNLPGLPTSSVGLPTGALWKDGSGFVKVV